jgi:acyl-CoA thioester hydrolase
MSKGKIITTNLNVRFRDLDALGHVNNAVFFTYFEQGRIHFFQQVFQISEPSDFNLILANISCKYLKPVKISDRLTLQLWVSKIGKKSFHLSYKVIDFADESVVYAVGESIQVWFDYEQNKTVEISKDQKKRLSAFLSATA